MPKNYCIMQIRAESGKSALPICNYSQILYQFLTFTQNLKRSHIVGFLITIATLIKDKLYITFFLSFYILSNVRKALFYRLYGHFYFLFTFAYRGISSYVFPLKRGKFRGKYFYAIRRFISVLALSIEECAYQSIVILILE